MKVLGLAGLGASPTLAVLHVPDTLHPPMHLQHMHNKRSSATACATPAPAARAFVCGGQAHLALVPGGVLVNTWTAARPWECCFLTCTKNVFHRTEVFPNAGPAPAAAAQVRLKNPTVMSAQGHWGEEPVS